MSKKHISEVTIATARHVEVWRIKVALCHGLNVRCTVPGMLAGVDDLKVKAARVRKPKGLTEVLTSSGWAVPLKVWTVEQAPAQALREKAAPQYDAHSCRPKSSNAVGVGNVAAGAVAGVSSLASLAVPPAVLCWLVAMLLMCGFASAQNLDNPAERQSSARLSAHEVASVGEVGSARWPAVEAPALVSPRRSSLVRPAAQGLENLGQVRALKSSGPGLFPALSKKSFFKPWGKGFVTSTAAYWSGAIADIASSRGKLETNPLLRNGHGGISVPRTLALEAGPYAITLLFEKHHPKAASILRLALGGLRFGVAVHNWRVK